MRGISRRQFLISAGVAASSALLPGIAFGEDYLERWELIDLIREKAEAQGIKFSDTGWDGDYFRKTYGGITRDRGGKQYRHYHVHTHFDEYFTATGNNQRRQIFMIWEFDDGRLVRHYDFQGETLGVDTGEMEYEFHRTPLPKGHIKTFRQYGHRLTLYSFRKPGGSSDEFVQIILPRANNRFGGVAYVHQLEQSGFGGVLESSFSNFPGANLGRILPETAGLIENFTDAVLNEIARLYNINKRVKAGPFRTNSSGNASDLDNLVLQSLE
ncbi:MAG: hypothetical protein V1659_02725 [Candidatus Woesearchaeota archaeon]